MAKHKRLNKLHLELSKNDYSKLEVSVIYNSLKLSLSKYINNYIRNFKRKYPISFKDLTRLVKVYNTFTDYYIGIHYDFLEVKDRELYLKILEVEYGVNGIEQRVLRRALEECFINL